MTTQDCLALGMGVLWMVTNILGAAFTIRHLQAIRRRRYKAVGNEHDHVSGQGLSSGEFAEPPAPYEHERRRP
jgi:hypothetical protein